MTDAPGRGVRILHVHPDLGRDLDGEALADARRRLTAPLLTLTPGPWDPEPDGLGDAVRGRPWGFLIADGVLVRELVLAGRVSATLNGPGDVLGLDDLAGLSLPVRSHYTVATPARLAVLDDHFLAGARRWPRLVSRLVEAATAQVGRGAAQQAVSQLARVEDRLIGLFWHLADRWGRVRPDGIVIDVPLTHEALGRLIGARRPTVSLGLQALAEHGRLTRTADGAWLLAPESISALADGAEAVDRLGRLLARPGGEQAPAPAAARLPEAEREALLQRLATLRSRLRPAHSREP